MKALEFIACLTVICLTMEHGNSNKEETANSDLGAVSSILFVGCEVKLKSNEYSTGVIVGKSKRGKDFWKVKWDDDSGITNTFGGHLDCY